MSIKTILISRGMSAIVGKSNGSPVGRVLQICEGDLVSSFDSKQPMKDIFYWKTVDLTDQERDDLNMALSSPHYSDDEAPIITYPKKTVDLNCFSAGEISTLEVRGTIAPGLGGVLSYSNFVLTIV